jgi:dolichyl-phosphate-mannose--protein O-mannosyl transferase
MMDGDMGSMMAWMMGFGLIGWVIVIGLLIAILVVLVRLLARQSASGEIQRQRGQEKPLKER